MLWQTFDQKLNFQKYIYSYSSILGLTHLKYKIKHFRRCDLFSVLDS